ncbi:hypothetical protein L228DRAFT_239293 [Xylona heveae TC161]|uniref:Aminoglycoside phosphotransferase domain-containing protein n=1 Tax=Xylona heveae (strain CBS 132557 / TC161) TaxID=1328760 RepID=A0A165GKN6_XYLHT|nr:hypothetical protein L228DRAFT_239293 [Xylona heveae TC161]KZF22308.1 hypothetical protein L228DRAFT_239293 [Xylona heveae TC161]
MSITRRLLRREITYDSAKGKEVNILHQLGYYDQRNQFFAHLDDNHLWIRKVVAYHLGLKSSTACRVAEVEDWLHGSFNVCIPVVVPSWNDKRVLIRFPLPYRVGEAFRPGNGDEKIRCEAGTYAWLQENCPDIPIPLLYGFALSTGETFTRLENLPALTRWFQILRRKLLSWLGYPAPSKYLRRQTTSIPPNTIGAGYILVEYIEETQGVMLSNTWEDGQHDTRLRTNFFRGLSRILLDMSRIPCPRIGSFIIDNDGFLKLANRPLSIELQQLENENIPTDIGRDYTYSTVDSYVVDLLGVHDNRFRYQPNAVNDLGDCIHQLSTLTAMRTVFHSFFQRDFRRGPFVLSLSDIHQSNIFVDADWNITCLVDLEWACSRPIELVNTPHWLTNKGIDQLVSPEYDVIRTEFMTILSDEEEKKSSATPSNNLLPRLSNVMNRNWESGTFWYTLALSSPSGVFTIFREHIRPLFCTDNIEEFNLIMPYFWGKSMVYTAGCKLADKEQYDEQLQQAFENTSLVGKDNVL